jgi:hypothetical protein
MARQCPRCELRFVTDVEVRDHLILEHGMEPEQLEQPYPLPGRSGPRSGSKSARYDAAERGGGRGRGEAGDPDRGV